MLKRVVVVVLVAGLLVGTTSLAHAFTAGFAPGHTTRVSVAPDGSPAAGSVQGGIVSRDGRYAVFASNASNLPGANGVLQVYRHDRVTGETLLASATSSGAATSTGAFSPSVSGDGRFVAFVSTAADVVAGDGNGALDPFVRDMTLGVTRAVATTPTGALVASGGSLAGFAGARALSDDGRYVAFVSASTELVPEANNGVAQAYVKDLLTGQVRRASVNGAGAAADRASATAVISGDGTVVAFQSASTNLLSPLVVSGAAQVYVRDLDAGTTTVGSVGASGAAQTFFASAMPSLSFDGSVLAFETQAALTGADLDGSWDVYVRDLAAGTTTLASPSATTAAGTDSRAPSLSSDGDVVAFHSTDPALVAGDTNGTADVFLFSRAAAALALVTLNDAGVQANGASTAASVSADGSLVLFASLATNLVTTPPSTGVQLYVRDLGTNAAPAVALPAGASLLEGEPLAAAGAFTDEDASTSWTATVDWGDGVVEPLALAPDKTFALARSYAPGAYTLTVTVTDDDGAAGSASMLVTVTNVAPSVTLPASAQVGFGTTLLLAGTFSDPGTGEAYTATVDYGEGDGAQPLALELGASGSAGSFALRHAYEHAGAYTVTVVVSDGDGGVTVATVAVVVRDFSFEWLDPVSGTFTVGRNLPVKFTVTAQDGSFVSDKSVEVTVRNAAGAIVVGPYAYGDQPSRSVTVFDGSYHVNVDMRGLTGGGYTLVVSFRSPQLTGEVALASSPKLGSAAR